MPFAPDNKPKRKKKRSKKKKRSLGGLIGNAVDEAQEMAQGLVPGVKLIADTTAHDVKRAVAGGGGSFKLDDLGKAIGAGMIQPYKPLASGNLRKFAQNVYERPLTPALDALTIVSLGSAGAGSLAAKVAKGTGDAGRVGRASRALAGLQLADSPLDDVAHITRSRTGRNVVGLKVAKPVTNRSGTQLVRREYRITDPLSGNAHAITLSQNPLRAATRVAAEKGVAKLDPNTRYIGNSRRVARAQERVLDRDLRKMTAQHETALRKAADGLSKVERRAFFLRTMGAHTDELIDKVRDAYVARAADAKPSVAPMIQARIKILNDPEIRAAAVAPSKKLQAAEDAARSAQDNINRILREGGIEPDAIEARRALEWKSLGLDVPDGVTPIIRTHHYSRQHKRHGDKSSQNRGAGKGVVPPEFRQNSAYNWLNALDDPDPQRMIKSHQDMARYAIKTRRFAQLLAHARRVDPTDADSAKSIGKDYVRIDQAIDPNGDLKARAERVFHFLETDANRELLEAHPAYADLMDGLRKFATARKAEGDAGPLVIPRGAFEEIQRQLKGSDNVLRRIIDRPTNVWRSIVLNMRPAWLVNNFIGQLILLSMSHGPHEAVKAYVNAARRGLTGKRGRSIADEANPSLTQSGFFHAESSGLSRHGDDSLVAKLLKFTPEQMGKLNAALTDDIPRRQAFHATIRPHVRRVQQNARKRGERLSFEEAGRVLLEDPKYVDMVTGRVLSDLIDFSRLSPEERAYIRPIVPFYSWLKGMTLRTGRMVAEQPHLPAVGARVSELGLEENERLLGSVPEYMRSAAVLKSDGDSATLLSMLGANPFMTPVDLANAVYGLGARKGPLWSSAGPLSNLNPIMRAPLEAAANRDFFYGSELDKSAGFGGVDPDGQSSFLGRWARQMTNSLPPVRTYRKLGQEDSPYRVYDPSMRRELYAYLGLPIKRARLGVAREQAMRDEMQG